MLFPPFSLIGAVINKIILEKVDAILVLPSFWFCQALKICAFLDRYAPAVANLC